MGLIAKLKQKEKYWYCSNCYMRLYTIETQCWYCGAQFSNYEDVLIENYEAQLREIK